MSKLEPLGTSTKSGRSDQVVTHQSMAGRGAEEIESIKWATNARVKPHSITMVVPCFWVLQY